MRLAEAFERLGRGSLTRFIASYQTVKTLRLGELWAVPIMLRLALIENLRRVAARVAASMVERDLAGLWADRVALLVDGRLLAVGRPDEVLTADLLRQAYQAPLTVARHPLFGTPLVLPAPEDRRDV